MLLGTTANFGPWIKSFSCASVRCLLETLITHLVLVLVLLLNGETPAFSVVVHVWLPCVFEPPLLELFLFHNRSSFFIFMFMILEYYASLLVLMKFWHSFRTSSVIIFSRSVLHVSSWWLNMYMELLIDQILLFSKTFSALLIIYWPLGVSMLLLSLMLTSMTSSERHLRENLL